jgi:hypothetical protein
MGDAWELPRCSYRFPSSTLCMPALAGDGEFFTRPLTVGAAILAALLCNARAPRMSALLSFLFGHDLHLPAFQYHLLKWGAIPDCEL